MKFDIKSSTIANTGTVGSAIQVGTNSVSNKPQDGFGVCAIYIPTSFEGTTLTFQGSFDGSTYAAIKKADGTDLSYTVAANTFVTIPANDLAGFPYIKPVSGTAVGADRVVQFVVRDVA